MTCPHGPRCPECQRQGALAAERDRRALAAQLNARSRPPTPAESAMLTPGEALSRFGTEGGLRVLEAEAMGQAGLTTMAELAAKRLEGLRQPGVAYREESTRLPVPPPRRQPVGWRCPNCSKVTAGPWCAIIALHLEGSPTVYFRSSSARETRPSLMSFCRGLSPT